MNIINKYISINESTFQKIENEISNGTKKDLSSFSSYENYTTYPTTNTPDINNDTNNRVTKDSICNSNTINTLPSKIKGMFI